MNGDRNLRRAARDRGQRARRAAFTWAALLLASCAASDLTGGRPSDAYGINGAVVLHDPSGGRLWTVDWDADAPRVRRSTWSGKAGPSLVGADGALVVLDSGDRALHRLAADAETPKTWALGAPFTALTACDDGAAAVTFHLDGAATGALVNTAEIALVDLSQPGSSPVHATVAGLARAPYAARCSAVVERPDGPHRLVWLQVQSALGLVDIGPGGSSSVVVPLAAPSSDAIVTPTRTVARIDAGLIDLYLIAGGISDVIHLRVVLGGATLAVSLDQIGVGLGPTELEVFDATDGLRAATLDAQARTVSLINPATGSGIAVGLEDPVARWTTFTDADGHRRALASGSNLQWLSLIDLDLLEKKKGKAISRLKLQLPATSVEVVGAHAVVRHGVADVVSVVDLASGKVSFFQGTGQVMQTLARGDAIYLLAWSATGQGQSTRLSRIRMSDLKGETLAFARKATALLPFGEAGIALVGAGFAGPFVGLWHDGAPGPGRWLDGFALEGALDQEAP